MTKTLVTDSNSVCSAHAFFTQHRRRLQLPVIEVIVLFAILSSVSMGQKDAPESPALGITIASVLRPSSGLVEIRYELKNKGSIDLYLPHFQIGGSTQVTTFSLLQRTSDGAWVSLGPHYDVASYKAKILKPGEVLTLIEQVSDPTIAKSLGPIAVQGSHRIKVAYYSGPTEWQQRLNTMKEQQSRQDTLKTPRVEVAYSEQFEIPPAAK